MFALGLFLLLNYLSLQVDASALLLTPLIKQNKTEEAKNQSSVDPSKFLNLTSYSGFLTVDEEKNSNIFFWYFPAKKEKSVDTPWIIWLQGGPICSSLVGAFYEVGPFSYTNGKLELRESTWNKDHSLVFIDNPVGAGYSFTSNGYSTDMSEYAANLYETVQQLTTLYPELRRAPLFIAGESYAGHFVPALGYRIATETQKDKKINLQGLMLGNALLDRDALIDYISVYEHWGLIDSQGAQALNPIQEKYKEAIINKDYNKTNDYRNQLFDGLETLSMQSNFYSIETVKGKNMKGYVDFLKKPEISNAIHTVGVEFAHCGYSVRDKLLPDSIKRVDDIMEYLFDNIRVLIYCGQLDLTIPCIMNSQYIRENWDWKLKKYFMNAPRTPWWFNETVVGYVKSGGGLTEVLVRGAGHMAPIDKPAELQNLISLFIKGFDMPRPTNYVVSPSDTPPLINTIPKIISEHNVSSHPGYIVSVIINCFLVILLISGVIYFFRWRSKNEAFFYSHTEDMSDGILSMS